jgi:glutaredoxin-like protein NrdH
MNISKISGTNNKHKVFVYALSTCVWCKLTKQYLNENNIQYEFVDVDLAEEEDKQKIHEKIQSLGGMISYPTTIVDDKVVVTGFRKDKLKEVLEI